MKCVRLWLSLWLAQNAGDSSGLHHCYIETTPNLYLSCHKQKNLVVLLMAKQYNKNKLRYASCINYHEGLDSWLPSIVMAATATAKRLIWARVFRFETEDLFLTHISSCPVFMKRG